MDTCKCGRLISWRLKGMCLACRYRETQKKDISKIRKRQPKKKTCVVCGKDFTTKTRTIICSPECRREYQLRKMREYSRAHHGEGFREKTCLTCGKVFKPTNPRNVYCSKECLETARREKREKKKAEPKPVAERACSNCGKSFVPAHPNSRYCSDECRDKTQRELQRQYNQAFQARQKAEKQKSEETPAPDVIPKQEAPKPKPEPKPVPKPPAVMPQMVVQKREPRPIYRKPAPVFHGPAPKASLKVNTTRLPKPYLRYVKTADMRMNPPDDYKEAREGSFAAIAAKEDMMRPIGTGKPIVYTPEEMQTIKEMYLAGETCTSIVHRLGKGQPGAMRVTINKLKAEGELPS